MKRLAEADGSASGATITASTPVLLALAALNIVDMGAPGWTIVNGSRTERNPITRMHWILRGLAYGGDTG
jgi:hypothetical protein